MALCMLRTRHSAVATAAGLANSTTDASTKRVALLRRPLRQQRLRLQLVVAPVRASLEEASPATPAPERRPSVAAPQGSARRRLTLRPAQISSRGGRGGGHERKRNGGGGGGGAKSEGAQLFQRLVRQGDLHRAALAGGALSHKERLRLESGFIKSCAASGNVSAALEYAHAVLPSRPYYCILIKELGQHRNLKAAREVYQFLEVEGVALNSYLISAMVHACGKCGEPVLARAYFDAAARSSPSEVDITCYNALMDAFGRCGDVDSVFALLRTITTTQRTPPAPTKRRPAEYFGLQLGLLPNTRSFNIAICAAARAQDVTKARAAWERMCRTQDAEPTHHTFSTLIRLAGESGDLVWATDLYNKMRETGLRPNNHVASAFLSVCARALRTAMAESQRELGSRVWGLQRASLLAQADTVMREVSRVEEPNEAVYNAFITCCERAQEPERAWNALFAMEESGLQPNLFLLSSMLKVCKIDHDLEGARRLVHMYMPELGPLPLAEELELMISQQTPIAMLNSNGYGRKSFSSRERDAGTSQNVERHAHPRGTKQRQSRGRESRVHNNRSGVSYVQWESGQPKAEKQHSLAEGNLTHVYNSFIDFCSSMGMIDLALRTYYRMCEIGPSPDLITYNTLIKGCSSNLQTDRVQQLYCDLQNRHLKPNQITFGAIIDGFGLRGETARAWQWVVMMEEHGFEPNVQVYTSLINSAVKRRDGQEIKHALVAFERMCSRGVQPNVQTYGALLKACKRSCSSTHAEEVYQHMLASGVPPNDACHKDLLAVFKNEGRLREAIVLVKSLGNEFKHVASKDFIPSIVRALCSKDLGEIEMAWEVMHNLRVGGKQPDRRTYSSMVEALARDAQLVRATEMHDAMKQQHYELDLGGRSELIVALSHAGQVSRAISLIARESRHTYLSPWAVCSLICACGRGSGRLSVALQLYDKLVMNTVHLLQHDPQHLQSEATASPEPRDRSDLYKVTVTDTSSMLHREGKPSVANFDLSSLPCFSSSEKMIKEGETDNSSEDRQRGLEAIRALSNKGGMVFEVLVEGLCRANHVEEALVIFDDMLAVGGSMSTATLAFLYACCMRSCYGSNKFMDDYATKIRTEMRERQQHKSSATPADAADLVGHATVGEVSNSGGAEEGAMETREAL